MPILLVYMTVLVESDGTVFFREDVYDRDCALLRVLNERNEALVTSGCETASCRALPKRSSESPGR
jgi:hypothetical protein